MKVKITAKIRFPFLKPYEQLKKEELMLLMILIIKAGICEIKDIYFFKIRAGHVLWQSQK